MFSSKIGSCCYKYCTKNLRENVTNLSKYSCNFQNIFQQKQVVHYSINRVKRKDKYDTVRGKESETPYKDINPYSADLTKLMTATKIRKERYRTKTIMLEGKRLIEDALLAGIKPLMILFTRKKLLENLPLPDYYVSSKKTILRKIPYEYLQDWSNLTTCPGITGLFEMPDLERKICPSPTLPITIVCDNVREPGNLGAILRIAAAIPVERVMTLNGCVDLWDTKVIRSSCGAMFNLRIHSNCSWEDVEEECSGNVIIADHVSAMSKKDAEVMSADEYVSLRPADVDIHDEMDIEDAEEESEVADIQPTDPAVWRQTANLPCVAYSDLEYKHYNSLVIIIGGETEGLSQECFLYAQKRNAARVHVPQAECVNSLNVATALGIITFEIKRQLSSARKAQIQQ